VYGLFLRSEVLEIGADGGNGGDGRTIPLYGRLDVARDGLLYTPLPTGPWTLMLLC